MSVIRRDLSVKIKKVALSIVYWQKIPEMYVAKSLINSSLCLFFVQLTVFPLESIKKNKKKLKSPHCSLHLNIVSCSVHFRKLLLLFDENQGDLLL